MVRRQVLLEEVIMVDYLGQYEQFTILIGKSLMAQLIDVGSYGTARAREGAISTGQKYRQLYLVGAQSGTQLRNTAHISVLNEMN